MPRDINVPHGRYKRCNFFKDKLGEGAPPPPVKPEYVMPQSVTRSQPQQIQPQIQPQIQQQITPQSQAPQKKGSGKKLLPGDKLKLKLIRKMLNDKKGGKMKGAGLQIHEVIAKQLFPKLSKLLDGKTIPAAQLKNVETMLKKKVKSVSLDDATATKFAGALSNIFHNMGHTHAKSQDSKKLIKLAVLKTFDAVKTGQGGSGKLKNLLKSKSFWSGFRKGFVSTLKVGLPIATLVAPELAPLTAVVETLL